MRPIVPVAGCCPLHMIGFAAGHRCEVDHEPAPAPSFSDNTPKAVSDHCRSTLHEGQELFEQAEAGQVTLFQGVTVLPMIGPERLPRHDVAVRDGTILAVVPTGSQRFAEARIVQGAGKVLMPGLSDMHIHVFTRNWAQTFTDRMGYSGKPEDFTLPTGLSMLQQVVHGVTRIEVMAGDPDMLHVRNEAQAGRLIAPTMRVGSPLIDGPQPMQSSFMSMLCGDAEGGRAAFQRIVQDRFDFAKPYSNLPADAYEALLDACESGGVPVVGHIPLTVGVDVAVAAGRQSIAHAGELFMWLEGAERHNRPRIERLAKQLASNGCWTHLTGVVTARAEQVFAQGATIDNYPDGQFCNPLVSATFAPDSAARQAIKEMPHVATMIADLERLVVQTIKALRDSGARLTTGTDAPNPFLAEGASLHEELAFLVERCEFTPLEALKLVTVNAADYHGESGRAGIVSQGAFADLILLDEDPLENIHATRSIDAVMVRGAMLDRDRIRIGRDRILQAYAAMPEPVAAA